MRGHDPRHRGLHVAGAGEGQAGRQAHRHLGVRLRALRDAHRPAGLRGRGRHRHAGRDPARRTRLDAVARAAARGATRSSAGAWSATGAGASGRCPRCDSCSRIPRCCRRRAPPPRQMDAEAAQARLETAVAQARRHVLVRRVLPLAGLAAVAVVAAGVGFSRDVTPPHRRRRSRDFCSGCPRAGCSARLGGPWRCRPVATNWPISPRVEC